MTSTRLSIEELQALLDGSMPAKVKPTKPAEVAKPPKAKKPKKVEEPAAEASEESTGGKYEYPRDANGKIIPFVPTAKTQKVLDEIAAEGTARKRKTDAVKSVKKVETDPEQMVTELVKSGAFTEEQAREVLGLN